MKVSKSHTHHYVCIGLNKIVKCFCHLLSGFGPFEVCVTLFICLLHRKHTDSQQYSSTFVAIRQHKISIYYCKKETAFCQGLSPQQELFHIYWDELIMWHDQLRQELWSLPWILQYENPELLWSSASPSTACTWFSALPAGLVLGQLGPLGPQPPSSHTCRYEAVVVLGTSTAPPRGMCCEKQCLVVFIVTGAY